MINYSNFSDGELRIKEQEIIDKLEVLKNKMLKDLDDLESLKNELEKIYLEYNAREQ